MLDSFTNWRKLHRLPPSMAEMKSLERVALIGNNIQPTDTVVEQLSSICVSHGRVASVDSF